MSPSHAVKNNKRYRYYISQALLQNRSCNAAQVARVPAHDIEALVIAKLRSLLQDPGALLDLLTGVAPELAEQHALLQAAAALAARWPGLSPAEVRTLVRTVVGEVVMRDDQIDIALVPARLRDVLHTGPDTAPAEVGETGGDRVPLSIDVRLKRGRGGEIKLIVPARAADARSSAPNPALIKALVRAHRCFDQLRSGQASSLRQIARTEGLTKRHVARIFPLAFLAPDIQAAILDGSQPPELTLDQLCQPLPLTWPEQRALLGFPQPRRPGEQHLRDRLPAPGFANGAQGYEP